MSASLLIRDGDPWWMSPDIWTVPGSDPNGSAAIPAVGQASFVWARVKNTSSTQLQNVRLNYYWSNPATGVLRSNSTLIGTAFATLSGGETSEVLCLTPWIPEGMNNGHECLVVEAVHSSEPLPSPLPDQFSPPSYNQVAQRNINLIRMARGMMRSMAIQIATPQRYRRVARVHVSLGNAPLPDEILASLGLRGVEFTEEPDIRVGLALQPEISCRNFEPSSAIKFELEPGSLRATYLQVLAGELSPKRYSIINVIDHDSETEEMQGGVSFIITGQEG